MCRPCVRDGVGEKGRDQVADDAEAVVDGALDLLDDHLVGAAHEDRHRLAVLALLHKQHPVLRRPERHLPSV